MKQSGKHKGHKILFASLRFARKDTEPDDFRPEVCCVKLPSICAGILLFDVLIANDDRHRYNIQTDSADNPKVIRIIDHDRALFGCLPKRGTDRLDSLLNRLGTSGGSMTQGARNCLLSHITDKSHFEEWLSKIQSIPDWFIEETCAVVRGVGATRKEVEAAVEFLTHRKNKLSEIVYNGKAEFTGIKSDDWGLFV